MQSSEGGTMQAESTTGTDRRFIEGAELTTIGASFRQAVERFADRTALVQLEQGVRLTYAELGREVDRAARAFIAQGVRQGDGVAIWSQGRYEWVVTQLAIARVGGVLVTIEPGCDTAELEQQLYKGRVGMLMMARGHGGVDRVQMVVDALRGCPELRRVIVLEHDWEGFLAGGDGIADEQLAAREALLELDDPINLQFAPCSLDDYHVATLSHRDVLCTTCMRGTDERDREWMPILYRRLATILGSIVCAGHPACVTI